MCKSENINRAMLQVHVGRDVTVILDTAQNNVFQGVLDWQSLSGKNGEECWIVTTERGLMHQGDQKVAVPQTKIYFAAKSLKAIVVPQETQREAAAIIESENISISLASPGWGHQQ